MSFPFFWQSKPIVKNSQAQVDLTSQKQHPSIDTEDESIHLEETPYGLGVFASKAIYAGQIIGEVFGKIINDEDYSSEYCIDLGDNQSLEPAAPLKYLNHCCTPNCTFVWIEAEETTFEINGLSHTPPDVILEAVQDITPGEQLTIDYCWSAESAIPCQCNSPDCRGWVVDEDELYKLSTLTTPKSIYFTDSNDTKDINPGFSDQDSNSAE